MAVLRGGSSIAVLLAAGALALGACGGDDESDTVGATQPTVTGETTGTTGTTENGTTEKGTTTKERTRTGERGTTTRERGDDSGGGNRGRGSDGSGGGSRGSDGSGGGSRGSDDSGSTSQPATQPGNVRKVARTVCNSFLPKAVERDLEQGDRKEEDVARAYARGFQESQRDDAYKGCLAGLKARG